MDVHQTLICFFFFTLRGRNTGIINAEILGRTGTEGGDILVACIFTFSGKRKIFCQEPCERGDFLIETDDVTAQRGRYSIKYIEGTFPASSTILYVSITKLIKSDEGKYRCGLHRSYTPYPLYWDIEIRVEEASVPSASTLTTTQCLSSSTGSYTPSSASPEGTQQSQKEQTPAAGVLLYVRLTLVIMIIVLSAAVLIICRKRASKPKEPSVEAVYANVTEANRVSEESEEDGQSRTPPLEMSAV